MAFKDENDSYLKPGMKDENEKMHATMGGKRPLPKPVQGGAGMTKPVGKRPLPKPVPKPAGMSKAPDMMAKMGKTAGAGKLAGKMSAADLAKKMRSVRRIGGKP